MRRVLYTLLVAGVVLGGFLVYVLSGDVDVTTFRTARILRGDVVSTVTASGSVEAMTTVEVSSQLSGQIAALEADFNDVVTAGETLARLDPQSSEARVREAQAELEVAQTNVLMQSAAVERAKADLANAQGTLAVLDSQAASAQANFNEAARDLERKQALQSGSALSASELTKAEASRDSARALAQAAEAQVEVQKAKITSAEADIRIAEAALHNARAVVKQRQAALEQARVDLERTVIRAPIDGVVVSRDVDVGQTVAASLQAPKLFTLAGDLAQITVNASVDEADIGRVAVGQRVEFSVDAYPQRTFPGRVTQVRKAPQMFQSVVTYTVVIEAENPGRLLFPGMTTLVNIVVAEATDVLRVPNAALRFRPGGQPVPEHAVGEGPGEPGVVWVHPGGRELRPIVVRVGDSDGTSTALLQGELEEGDEVVVGAVRSGS